VRSRWQKLRGVSAQFARFTVISAGANAPPPAGADDDILNGGLALPIIPIDFQNHDHALSARLLSKRVCAGRSESVSIFLDSNVKIRVSTPMFGDEGASPDWKTARKR